MNVQPVVVPVKSFGIPDQQRFFIFSDAAEQGAQIVRAENISILVRKRLEDFKRFRSLVRNLFHAIDVAFHEIDHIDNAAATPARPGAIEQRRDLFGGCVNHRRRGGLESFRRHRSRLHTRSDLVDKTHSSIFFEKVFPFVQTHQTDDPRHIVGIGIARGRLVDQARLFDAGYGGNCQHGRRNLIHWSDIQNQFFIGRYLCLTFEHHENNRRRGREPFIPAGERIRPR